MAEEEIPENIDLRFIAKQNGRILREFGEMREQTKLIPQILADLSELQVTLAATRADLAIVKSDVETIKSDVETIKEGQKNHGARLNAIDGRLAIIEKHTGLVKA